ncbi:MAG: hypothetical protein BWY80_00125 [Firmicutes bacterium ADurb.Bin456]|nr:MAG: hypothetical protein BWY80_00125 [Firmicutes bacterium ADurb.Bin456]
MPAHLITGRGISIKPGMISKGLLGIPQKLCFFVPRGKMLESYLNPCERIISNAHHVLLLIEKLGAR